MYTETILKKYEIHEWRHASAVISNAFPEEWNNIMEVLTEFHLLTSDIQEPGGRKSNISGKLDSHLYRLGWQEKQFEIEIHVDKEVHVAPTHKVDCVKNRIALEIEWNNKDPFYDRDLNNFRLLFDLGAISAGVIITRCDELQDIFNSIGKGHSYGNSTTHMSKLIPRIESGSGGGCPILVFGIKSNCIVDDLSLLD